NIGVGFAGTANQLSITDSAQLQSALQNNPQGVAAFFQSGSAGLASTISEFLNTTIADDTSRQNDLESTDSSIGDQISMLQTQIANEKATLTAEFTAMESAMEQ